jgi:hypothetical protein
MVCGCLQKMKLFVCTGKSMAQIGNKRSYLLRRNALSA